jgi:serine/threonine protein kinase
MKTAELGNEQQVDQADRRLVADRYRLLARIGRGRLGEIYEADDEGHRELGVERRVAIQLLPDRITLDRGLFNKLKLGYTVLRAAPHPNIVPIVDFDHDGKFGYLVTDFLGGASLRVILDDSTTLPLDEVIPVIRAIGDALQFLHANSIVHGRLTAKNVFITDNLDVRLLDVVPLDSATTILRGVASGDPFSRCDIADDIYGLACLAYEMLAGKHPFNFHALAEARHTGLEPTRIDALPDKQWNALCHALKFDGEQQTPGIADFLHEFGVKGTERLRPSEDATPPRVSTGPSSSRPAPAPAAPATRSAPVARSKDALELARAKGKRTRRMPSPILIMVLVGLGAWYFFGQPRDDVTWLIDYTDSYLDRRPATTQPVIEIDPYIEATGSDSIVSATASNEITAIAIDAAATQPAGNLPENSETTESLSNNDATTDELASPPDVAGSTRSEPESTLIQSVVYVSERDGAARIASRHPGTTTDPVFWWTGDDTAVAEDDYIPLEQPMEGFTSGEEAETLHIPLINDSLRESSESFYVYLGQHDTQLGRLEPIARIRVEISDDD